jgi:hypothetical protein
MVPIPGVCTDYTGGVISHESTEGHTWGRQEKRSSTYVAPRGQSEEETALEASLYPYSTRWNKEFQMSVLPELSSGLSKVKRKLRLKHLCIRIQQYGTKSFR